jgi:hypothetical protein
MLTIKLADNNNKIYRASFHLPLQFNDVLNWSKEKTTDESIELFDKVRRENGYWECRGW